MLAGSTPRARYTILSIVPLIACLLIIPVVAHAVCPVTTLTCYGSDVYGDPAFNVSDESTGPSGSVAYGQSSASFDLVEGRLSAIAKIYEAHRQVSRVVASDRFYLHDVPQATFTIRLTVSWEYIADNYRQAWAGAASRVSAEGQSDEAATVGPAVDLDVEIEITAYEGVPFVVTYEAEANGWGYYPWSTVIARLHFVGLPEGATITSCNGYGETEVSVEESTWGRLKALYR